MATDDSSFSTSCLSAAVFATSKLLVKVRTGVVFAFQCSNANAAARYFQLYNQNSLPASGTPIYELKVANGSSANGVLPTQGIGFYNGVVAAFSTTSGSYVAATDADHNIYVAYT